MVLITLFLINTLLHNVWKNYYTLLIVTFYLPLIFRKIFSGHFVTCDKIRFRECTFLNSALISENKDKMSKCFYIFLYINVLYILNNFCTILIICLYFLIRLTISSISGVNNQEFHIKTVIKGCYMFYIPLPLSQSTSMEFFVPFLFWTFQRAFLQTASLLDYYANWLRLLC